MDVSFFATRIPGLLEVAGSGRFFPDLDSVWVPQEKGSADMSFEPDPLQDFQVEPANFLGLVRELVADLPLDIPIDLNKDLKGTLNLNFDHWTVDVRAVITVALSRFLLPPDFSESQVSDRTARALLAGRACSTSSTGCRSFGADSFSKVSWSVELLGGRSKGDFDEFRSSDEEIRAKMQKSIGFAQEAAASSNGTHELLESSFQLSNQVFEELGFLTSTSRARLREQEAQGKKVRWMLADSPQPESGEVQELLLVLGE